MYDNANMYLNTNYAPVPNYQPNMVRNNQGIDPQLNETIFAGLKGTASALDLYYRLAEVAPDQAHRNDLLQAAEAKNNHLQQLTNLYFSFTGINPAYQYERVMFETYQDGMQKAYQGEVETYEFYRDCCYQIHHPVVRDVFWRVMNEEKELSTRFEQINQGGNIALKDYGTNPFVVDIDEATKQNTNYRTALWTGDHLQVTLMDIEVGGDIGLEVHPNLDQFIRLEQGQGIVQMGDNQDQLDFEEEVCDDYAIMIPAGKWHNVTNTGDVPIKLYAIYAPPEHPFGTVHRTKEEAMASEDHS